MSPDIRVCPSCQTYNLPDASQCLQCGANLGAGASRKPEPAPPPLYDPDLDYGPFAGSGQPRADAYHPLPGSLARVALGLLIGIGFLVFLFNAPALALLVAIFGGPRLLRAWRRPNRWEVGGANSFPGVFHLLRGTLVAVAMAIAVGVLACGFILVVVIVAALNLIELFD